MRVFWAVSWVLALAVAGQAAPVPPPPDGFGGTQYVDGRGCVWHRDADGDGWQARLDKAGAAICGFPPSREARRTDPDLDRVLAPEHPEPAPSAEDLLAGKLAAGLRQGEFLDDPRAPEERRAPLTPTEPAALARDLTTLVQNQAAMRSALAGGTAPDSQLCRLLGYRPDTDAAPILGGDVTQGLCPGMRAPVPREKVTEGAVAVSEGAKPQASPADTAPAVTTAARVVMKARGAGDRRASLQPAAPAPKPAAIAPHVAGSVVDRRAKPAAPPETAVEMIPASARYVQIGGYAEDENAVAAIRRLSAMGYRVAQKRTRRDDRAVRLILAGPFTDRKSLIAALNRLRAEGYPGAVAR